MPSFLPALAQSDVARLRSIVVNSLYGSKEIFLRELLSNANDALEKLRLTSLMDRDLFAGPGELNMTIAAERDPAEVGGVGRLVLRDTGIGMSPDELKTCVPGLSHSCCWAGASCSSSFAQELPLSRRVRSGLG